jgi:hypothetical protein
MHDAVNSRWRQIARCHLAIGFLGLAILLASANNVAAQSLPMAADATAVLGAPAAILPSAAPMASSLPQAANFAPVSHAPAPSMLQVLTSASRGFCARVRVSPIGQMAANMRKPLSVATGGLIAPEKAPHPDEQAQPGPEGTAAQLKAVNLQAPKRRAAVRELRAVDVRYHPEAEAILVAALRADPSECVRYEAALTIATLPACTEKIAKALRTSIDSSSADGNPAELSIRVRNQAANALAKCECCLPLSDTVPQTRPEYPVTETPTGTAAQTTTASQGKNLPAIQSAGWRRPVDTAIEKPMRMAETGNLTPVQTNRPKNLLEVFKTARADQTE